MGEVAKKAATTGAVSGLAVAASGGSNQDALKAFLQSGGSVLVQSGQAYVKNEYVDPAMADGDAYCTTVMGGSCAAAASWVNNSKQYATQEISNTTGVPTAVLTGNRNWVVTWSKQAIQNVASNVPPVVLTYIGQGSPYYGKFQYVAKLGNPDVSEALFILAPDTPSQPGSEPEIPYPQPEDNDDDVFVLPMPDHSAPATGWIFLGKYLGNGEWEQPRSDDITGKSPRDLQGENISLNIGVRLRSSAFHVTWSDDHRCTYRESSVIGGIPTGTTINLKNVMRLRGCSRYVWAEVETQ